MLPLQVNVPRMLPWLSRTWLHRSRSRVLKDSWRSPLKIHGPWWVRSLSQIHYSGLASLIDRSCEDGLYKCYVAFSAGRPQRSGFVSQQFSNWIDRWSLPSKEKPSGSSPQDAESKESNRWSWLAVRTLLFLHPVKAVTKSNNGCPLWILCINRTIGLMIDWHDWTTARRNMTKRPAGGLLRRSTFWHRNHSHIINAMTYCIENRMGNKQPWN